MIVLDNDSVHRSALVKAAVPDLARVGVDFFSLPPSSPELNRIEALWRHVNYEELPTRSYQTLDTLRAAVTSALDDHCIPRPAEPDVTTNLPKAA